MNALNSYCATVLQQLEHKYPWEKPFLQAVNEVFLSIGMVVDQDHIYRHERILERIVEPERTYMFRVPWRDDSGNIQVNTGYRIIQAA